MPKARGAIESKAEPSRTSGGSARSTTNEFPASKNKESPVFGKNVPKTGATLALEALSASRLRLRAYTCMSSVIKRGDRDVYEKAHSCKHPN
jgi:hypothetical protein